MLSVDSHLVVDEHSLSGVGGVCGSMMTAAAAAVTAVGGGGAAATAAVTADMVDDVIGRAAGDLVLLARMVWC